MGELTKFIHRETMRELAIEGNRRALGEAIFTEWRDRYLASLLAYFRLHNEARRVKLSGIMSGPSRHWCGAAIVILTSASIELQDHFLRGSESVKDRMVEAVQVDGGLYDINGVFVELPL